MVNQIMYENEPSYINNENVLTEEYINKYRHPAI